MCCSFYLRCAGDDSEYDTALSDVIAGVSAVASFSCGMRACDLSPDLSHFQSLRPHTEGWLERWDTREMDVSWLNKTKCVCVCVCVCVSDFTSVF